jgi:hypothetical protein
MQLGWTDETLAANVLDFTKRRTDILPDLETIELKEFDAYLYLVSTSDPKKEAT